MASLKDDSINFDKLSVKAHKAMADEDLYWLRNDAKFRAVKQKGTYEEFKEIVAAAHLKPLEKKDNLQIDTEKLVSPWNSIAAPNTHTKVDKLSANNEGKTTSYITTCNQFVRHWRTLREDSQRLDYFLTIPADDLKTLFKNEIPFGLLGEFINILVNNYEKIDSKQCHNILDGLSQTGRLSLSLTFLSSKERSNLDELLNKLEDEDVDVVTLREKFK